MDLLGRVLPKTGPVPVILERLFPAVDPAAVALLYSETLDATTV